MCRPCVVRWKRHPPKRRDGVYRHAAGGDAGDDATGHVAGRAAWRCPRHHHCCPHAGGRLRRSCACAEPAGAVPCCSTLSCRCDPCGDHHAVCARAVLRALAASCGWLERPLLPRSWLGCSGFGTYWWCGAAAAGRHAAGMRDWVHVGRWPLQLAWQTARPCWARTGTWPCAMLARFHVCTLCIPGRRSYILRQPGAAPLLWIRASFGLVWCAHEG